MPSTNLFAWLGAVDLVGAAFTVSCGDTQRNKNYRVAVYGHQKSDPVEARACARYALTERPKPGAIVPTGPNCYYVAKSGRLADCKPWCGTAHGWSTSSTNSLARSSPRTGRARPGH